MYNESERWGTNTDTNTNTKCYYYYLLSEIEAARCGHFFVIIGEEGEEECFYDTLLFAQSVRQFFTTTTTHCDFDENKMMIFSSINLLF